MSVDPRSHWQAVYTTRRSTEVSWYQPAATLSLSMIRRVAPDHAVAIIDVGGGASTLADGLLAGGYTRVTVLDVSSAALDASRARLGHDAERVNWLEANVLDTELPPLAYDLWHDRAVFHFLTDAADRRRYVEQVRASLRRGGHVIVAAFAPDGPAKCSGLEVARYASQELHGQFGLDFQLLGTVREEHRTPSGAIQPFTYCLCRRRKARARRER